jgi:arabinosaccharide transport system substrate-binding protein
MQDRRVLALTPRRRLLRLGVALAAGVMVVASCGGDGEGDTGGEVGADQDAESSDMASNPDNPGEDIELEFWTFVDNHADFLIAQAERFNEENDDYNILISSTTINFGEMHDRLLVALQSGAGAPDLVDIEIGRFGTFTRGDVALHPLDDVVDPYRAELVEERLAPYQVDGVPYGIDYHLGAYVMYYNKEIMEEAGVDVDAIVTWDDYIDAGKQVVANTDAVMATVETGGPFSIRGPMLQNGGGVYNENNDLIMESPANVEAVEMVASMVHEHEIATVAPGGDHHDPAFFEAFNNGESASLWMPQWYMVRFPDQMPDTEGKMLVRPLPAFEEGGMVSTMGGGTGTAITRQIDESKIDAVKEFLGYAKLTYDAQVRLWTELGFDPFRNDVYDDPALSEEDPWFDGEQVMANLQSMFDRLAPEYTGPRYPEATTALIEIVAYETLEEGVDPQTALTRAADDVRSLD